MSSVSQDPEIPRPSRPLHGKVAIVTGAGALPGGIENRRNSHRKDVTKAEDFKRVVDLHSQNRSTGYLGEQRRGSGTERAARRNSEYFVSNKSGAIVNMTRAMAANHAVQTILVNCVCPSMARGLLKTEGNGWEVGNAVRFLASDLSRWATGAVLPVDAGTTAATGIGFSGLHDSTSFGGGK
ncbi:hypothetical protein RU639_006117 [Aspergillus parasiticus]